MKKAENLINWQNYSHAADILCETVDAVGEGGQLTFELAHLGKVFCNS